MGGGFLGALALVVIALAFGRGSTSMNDYSGSLALQTVGVRRPPADIGARWSRSSRFFSSCGCARGGHVLRFQNVVLLFVGYWILLRRGSSTSTGTYRARGPQYDQSRPARAPFGTRYCDRRPPASITFVVASAARRPIHGTSIIRRPVATAWEMAPTWATSAQLLVAGNHLRRFYRVWRTPGSTLRQASKRSATRAEPRGRKEAAVDSGLTEANGRPPSTRVVTGLNGFHQRSTRPAEIYREGRGRRSLVRSGRFLFCHAEVGKKASGDPGRKRIVTRRATIDRMRTGTALVIPGMIPMAPAHADAAPTGASRGRADAVPRCARLIYTIVRRPPPRERKMHRYARHAGPRDDPGSTTASFREAGLQPSRRRAAEALAQLRFIRGPGEPVPWTWGHRRRRKGSRRAAPDWLRDDGRTPALPGGTGA